jgi:nicotinamidase-related amidase
VTVVFWGLVKSTPDVQAGDDAAEAAWWPLDKLPPLAFDHDEILALAKERVAQTHGLAARSQPFLSWLETWLDQLPTLSIATLDPANTAAMAVDLVRGFCTVGPLASPRVQGIVPHVVTLFDALYEHGVRHFLLSQDAHSKESPEFKAFAPHCLAGSAESETVPELLSRPFSQYFTHFEKNSLSSTLGTGLIPWLEEHPQVNTFIIVGDCTDLCIYEAAMALRLRANAFNQPDLRVIVPVDCVQTYDLPLGTAQTLGIMPHEGDLLHSMALYMMALNGIEVVSSLV